MLQCARGQASSCTQHQPCFTAQDTVLKTVFLFAANIQQTLLRKSPHAVHWCSSSTTDACMYIRLHHSQAGATCRHSLPQEMLAAHSRCTVHSLSHRRLCLPLRCDRCGICGFLVPEALFLLPPFSAPFLPPSSALLSPSLSDHLQPTRSLVLLAHREFGNTCARPVGFEASNDLRYHIIVHCVRK